MIGPSHLLNENGDLSFLLYFSKQCLVENIPGKFQKNSSVTFISENHLRKNALCLSQSAFSNFALHVIRRFKPILSAGLRFHSHLSGGLRLRNYRAVARNHKFSSRFSVFAFFCGGYSNRVKRLKKAER